MYTALTRIVRWIVPLIIISSGVAFAQATGNSVSESGGVPATTTSDSPCIRFSRNLAVGAQGTDIMQLQKFLATQGFFTMTATGYFGPITRQAVIDFQSAHGISPIGFVGPLTRTAIASVSCGTTTTLPSTPCIPRPACLDATPRCLIPEPAGGWCSSNPPLSKVCPQDAKLCPDGTSVGRTGPNCEFAACPTGSGKVVGLGEHCGGFITNPNTCAEGLRCQLSTVVDAGGVCVSNTPTDSSTNQTVSVSSISPTTGPVGTSVTVNGSGFTSDNTVLMQGGVQCSRLNGCTFTSDAGAIVHVPSTNNGTSLTFTIPSRLNPICRYSIPPCEAESWVVTPGSYNIFIKNANGTSSDLNISTMFQVTGDGTNGSTDGVDAGIIGVEDNNVIPADTSCVTLTNSLSLGAQGNDVTMLQRALTSGGFLAPGYITGYFGPITRQAVIDFQSAHGISPIGFVGPLTRTAIESVSCGTKTTLPSTPCLPRPACLDATPRCLIPEPAGGWCPSKPTS
jgi:peptidoglycan hydrolase-like protein with peptidoglycan-binding domain